MLTYEETWHIKCSIFKPYFIKKEQLTLQISRFAQNVADMCRSKVAAGRNELYNAVDELSDDLSDKNMKGLMVEFDWNYSSNPNCKI